MHRGITFQGIIVLYLTNLNWLCWIHIIFIIFVVTQNLYCWHSVWLVSKSNIVSINWGSKVWWSLCNCHSWWVYWIHVEVCTCFVECVNMFVIQLRISSCAIHHILISLCFYLARHHCESWCLWIVSHACLIKHRRWVFHFKIYHPRLSFKHFGFNCIIVFTLFLVLNLKERSLAESYSLWYWHLRHSCR